MIVSKSVTGVFALIALFDIVYGIPHPDVIRERHIIRAPIKFKVIHHHKVQKVPIVIKKHIHYYKPEDVKPVVEHTDHVPNEYFKNRKPKEHHHDDDHDHDHYHGLWDHYGFGFHDAHEDYEDHHHHHHQPLQEEYEDYEYE